MANRSYLRAALTSAVAAAALGVVPAAASAATASYGYVWADQSSAASYTPSTAYQQNSSGALNTITRSSAGRYSVDFPGLARAGNGGTVNVTAYRGGNTACEVTGWGGDGSGGISVGVSCTDTYGTPLDSQFDATYAVPVKKGTLGYVWADSPSFAGTYTPSAYYQFNSKGLANTITRYGLGSYSVTLPGLGTAGGGTVKVTAYGGYGYRCKVTGWGANGTAENVGVQCYNVAGTPVDSYFTMTYAAKRNLLGTAQGFGYAWADQPSSASYTPSAYYAKTKPQGGIGITRTAAGVYVVTFQGIGTAARSDVQVTAYGSGANECKVGSWTPSGAGQAVNVWCFNTDGVLTDSYYTIQFIR